MQHHVYIRTAVAEVDDAVVAHRQRRAELLEQGHLAVAGGDTLDRLDLARCRIVPEPRAVDVLRRHDAFQRRLDHLFGSG